MIFSPRKQSSPAGCSLHFSATGGVITISKAILEADVEYTFDLSVWKMGLNPESTNQTVRTSVLTVLMSAPGHQDKAQSHTPLSRQNSRQVYGWLTFGIPTVVGRSRVLLLS